MLEPLPLNIVPMKGLEEARICAEIMADSDPWRTLGRDFDFGLKMLTDPMREAHVARVSQTLAGFVILNLHGPFKGYIQSIAVKPQYRRQGVGEQLMRFAEKRIFQESPNAFLSVSSFNTGARRFYARLGYEQIGEIKDFVVKGYSELLLRKTTGPLNEFRRQEG